MQRSHAYALATNRADDDEIAAALTDAVRADLPLAVAALERAMRPAADIELMGAVGRVTILIGQGWSRDAREEFNLAVTSELLDSPGSLVLDALARARRRVTDGRSLLAWVCTDIEPAIARMELEAETLEKLATLAA